MSTPTYTVGQHIGYSSILIGGFSVILLSIPFWVVGLVALVNLYGVYFQKVVSLLGGMY